MDVPISSRVWGFAEHVVLFLAWWVIISLVAGYTIGINLLTPLLAIIATILTSRIASLTRGKQNPSHAVTDETVPLFPVLLVGTLLIAGFSFVLFNVQGGFDLSADATPSVAAQFIGTHIPTTYAPYFDLPFLYQLGVPLLVSQLHVLIGVPLHVAGWAFALVGMLIALLFLARIAVRISGNARAALFACVLFLGLRLPFINMLVGEYPWMLALGLALAGMSFVQDKKPSEAIVLFAAILIIHPFIAVNALIFLLVAGIFQEKKAALSTKEIFTTIILVGLVIAFILVNQALPFLQLARDGSTVVSETIPNAFVNVPAMLFFIGIVPLLIALGFLILRYDQSKKLLLSSGMIWLIILGVVGFTIFSFIPQILLVNKLIEMASVGVLLFASAMLAKQIPARFHLPLFFVLVLVCGGILLASNDIQRLEKGSKATIAEAKFATWFGQWDAAPKKVAFFSRGNGKMSQYAEKIPVMATAANFTLALHLVHNAYAQALLQQSDRFMQIFTTRCVQCVDELSDWGVDYIIVNPAEFPLLTDRAPLAVEQGFYIYAGKK